MAKTADKEKENRRVIAITKQLREKKGIVIKKQEIDLDLKNLKKAQKDIAKIAEEDGSDVVKQVAKEETAKLQNVIDDLNSYMGIIYPEGLIDLGGDDLGSSISISG